MIYSIVLLMFAAISVPWQNPENWQKLSKTSTDAQVRQILGNPAQIKQLELGQVWYYSDKAYVKLRFKPVNGRKTLFVTDFTPPVIPNPLAGEESAKKTAADVPPVAQPKPVVLPASGPVAHPKPVTAAMPEPAKKMENGQLKIENAEASASHYFIWVGGGIIAIAVIIAISQGAKLFE